MIKYLFVVILTLCFAHAAPKTAYNAKVLEDTYTLYALDAQMRHKFQQSSVFFAELYKETSKKEYLYQSLRMLEQSNDIKALSKSTLESLKTDPEDEILRRFEIIVLLKEGKFAEASQKALVLSEKGKKSPDYLLYAETRLKLGDFSGATAALKKSYDLNYDESTAERIALIHRMI